MYILGISCFYHDSSACLLRDGEVIAAAQEERFSRVKNTSEFPIESIRFCLKFANIEMSQIDHVAYFEKPYLKFARVIIDHIAMWPFSWNAFRRSMPTWLNTRLSLPTTISKELGYNGSILYLKHHLSHAASAFYQSPFESAAIITADGVGEWATFSVGVGRGNKIEIEKEIHYPNSLGLLYTTVTTYLGFPAHGCEGQTMGLAGYGDPNRYLKEMQQIVKLREDGSFEIDEDYFAFRKGKRMWGPRWVETFGPPRTVGEPWLQKHYDIAAACQAIVENVFIANARLLQKKTGLKKLCLAGGVTLNCVANAKILAATEFDDIFVQPAAGDAGGSVGAALAVYHQILGNPVRHRLDHAYLGPEFSDDEIELELKAAGLSFRKLDESTMCREVAAAIHGNRVIGWFQGRMEFGPRALGNRSIIGNATFEGMKDILNLKIKKREAFRPFAPIVLEERADEYFHLPIKSPYMLIAPQVRKEKMKSVPAITHIDGTARVQTCDRSSNLKLRQLIVEFEKLSGVPVIINTSFNGKGEPVVCQPIHAIRCFVRNEMDVLAIGSFLVENNSADSSQELSEMESAL